MPRYAERIKKKLQRFENAMEKTYGVATSTLLIPRPRSSRRTSGAGYRRRRSCKPPQRCKCSALAHAHGAAAAGRLALSLFLLGCPLGVAPLLDRTSLSLPRKGRSLSHQVLTQAQDAQLWPLLLKNSFPEGWSLVEAADARALWTRFQRAVHRRSLQRQPTTKSLPLAERERVACLLRTLTGYAFLRESVTLAFADEDGDQLRVKYRSRVSSGLSLPPQPELCCSLTGDTMWATATTSVVGWDIERRRLYCEIPNLYALISIAVRGKTKRRPAFTVTPTKEALLALTTLSSVSLYDIRTPGPFVSQLPYKWALDATADDTFLYICNAEWLKIHDRRMPNQVMAQLAHRNTARNVCMSHSAPSVLFTSTHGDSLRQRDCAVRAWKREDGEWKLQGNPVEFQSGVRALASCGDHAIAIGQKGEAKVVSSRGEQLLHLEGKFISCDIDYTRAALLHGEQSLTVLSWDNSTAP